MPAAIKTRASRSMYTPEQVLDLVDQPHKIGWLCGKDLLQPIHSDWIKYIWDDPEIYHEDRALQAHRGSYKSTSVLVIGAVRWMLGHPNDRIAIVRKTFSDAAEVVDTIARVMKRPEIQALWTSLGYPPPKAVVERHGLLTYSFKTSDTPEGSITAHGLDGSLTGKHYDKILCDDIITLKDRISRAERERTKEMIRELCTNIIDPGHYVGWIGTPWHRNDGWTVIPARPLRFPISACNILTPEQIEEKRRHTTPFLFAANYELNLQTEEGTLFKNPLFGHWDNRYPAYGHIDAAFDGDHTCGLTIMGEKNDGVIQAKGWVYPGNVKDWLGKIVSIYKEYKLKELFIETNPDKGYTADALASRGINVSTYPETQNKHVKIATHLYEAWERIFWDEGTEPEYMEQVLDYREGSEPDDAPDSAASLIRQRFSVKSNKEALWDW